MKGSITKNEKNNPMERHSDAKTYNT